MHLLNRLPRWLRLLLLAAGLGALLAACGGNGGDTPTVDTSAAQAKAQVAASVAAQITADPSVDHVMDEAAKCEPLTDGGMDALTKKADSAADVRKLFTMGKYLKDKANRLAFYACVQTNLQLGDSDKEKFKTCAEDEAFKAKLWKGKDEILAYLRGGLSSCYQKVSGIVPSSGPSGSVKAPVKPSGTPSPTLATTGSQG